MYGTVVVLKLWPAEVQLQLHTEFLCSFFADLTVSVVANLATKAAGLVRIDLSSLTAISSSLL